MGQASVHGHIHGCAPGGQRACGARSGARRGTCGAGAGAGERDSRPLAVSARLFEAGAAAHSLRAPRTPRHHHSTPLVHTASPAGPPAPGQRRTGPAPGRRRWGGRTGRPRAGGPAGRTFSPGRPPGRGLPRPGRPLGRSWPSAGSGGAHYRTRAAPSWRSVRAWTGGKVTEESENVRERERSGRSLSLSLFLLYSLSLSLFLLYCIRSRRLCGWVHALPGRTEEGPPLSRRAAAALCGSPPVRDSVKPPPPRLPPFFFFPTPVPLLPLA